MFKELLAKEGITCLLRNEQLSTALGEIPFTECYPELWVVDAETWPRAKMLLDGWLKVADPEAVDWTCSGCGETSAGNFTSCWSCGRDHDGEMLSNQGGRSSDST